MFLVIAVSLFSVIFTVNKCYQYKDEVAQKDNIINSIGSKFVSNLTIMSLGDPFSHLKTYKRAPFIIVQHEDRLSPSLFRCIGPQCRGPGAGRREVHQGPLRHSVQGLVVLEVAPLVLSTTGPTLVTRPAVTQQ